MRRFCTSIHVNHREAPQRQIYLSNEWQSTSIHVTDGVVELVGLLLSRLEKWTRHPNSNASILTATQAS
jgi:hypothetical protein